MRFAYADPPYLGCGALYAKDHPDALIWDDPETHSMLIARLCDEYPDGWAMSASSPSMTTLGPLLPVGHRVCPWVKPFCSFKPNVGVAYAWEPVIIFGGRRRLRTQRTIRDWFSCGTNQPATVRHPRYGDRLSKTVDASGWSAWEKPVHKGYKLACCTCGLVHRMNFRVRRGKVEWQAKIDRRASAAMRRGKRYQRIKEALKS